MCTASSRSVPRASATAAWRGRDRAVDGLPGVLGGAGPGLPLGSDVDAHPGRRHGRADAAAALEPPLQFELLQGLPERGAGDAEARGQVPLVGQDLAHGELRVQCLAEYGPQMPVLRFRYRFQLRGPHPVLRNRRGTAAFSRPCLLKVVVLLCDHRTAPTLGQDQSSNPGGADRCPAAKGSRGVRTRPFS